jgi:hypothetical protein
MPNMMRCCASFVPFVRFMTFVPFVRRRGWRENEGHDEAAQSVANRRRHPITLTKTARAAGPWAITFCDLP